MKKIICLRIKARAKFQLKLKSVSIEWEEGERKKMNRVFGFRECRKIECEL